MLCTVSNAVNHKPFRHLQLNPCVLQYLFNRKSSRSPRQLGLQLRVQNPLLLRGRRYFSFLRRLAHLGDALAIGRILAFKFLLPLTLSTQQRQPFHHPFKALVAMRMMRRRCSPLFIRLLCLDLRHEFVHAFHGIRLKTKLPRIKPLLP